jgi:dipeptide/tripeptide permease
MIVVAVFFFAIGEMMASPTSQEYIGRIAPSNKVALYMGYYFVAVALGNLFGNVLSGVLYGKLARDAGRPDVMWLAFGLVSFATAVALAFYNRFAALKQDAAA